MLTPCTTRRPFSVMTLMTSPRLPLSSRRPLMTSTVSPLWIFTLISITPVRPGLQNFRGQRHDFHEQLVAQLARHRPTDAGSAWILAIGIQDHRRVVVKAGV